MDAFFFGKFKVVMVTTPWQISIKLVFSLSLSLSAVPFTALYISIPPGKKQKKSILEKKTTFQRQPKIQKQFECC
jgi:hypothetical protein